MEHSGHLTRRRTLVALSVSACALATATSLGAQQMRKVRVGSTLDDAITPILYGIQSGLFGQLGIDVQLQSFASGAALTSAVVGGAIDVGKSSMFALFAAHAHGVPLKIVAGAAQYTSQAPTSELIVATDSSVKSAADLDGKTVAASALNSLDAIATRAWVDQHGGRSSTLNFIELPNTAMIPAVEEGRVAAASPSNPALQEALDTGKVRVLAPSFDAIGDRFLIAAWFCTAAYIAQNNDAVRRFAEGVGRASTFTNAHHADTVQLLANYAHMPADVIAKMNRLTNATSVDPKAIEPSIAAAVKYGIIDKTFPATDLIADLGTGHS